MTDDQASDDRPTGSRAKLARQDRLKLALRENLKRRKSQARGRSETAASTEPTDASLDDSGGRKQGL